MNRDDKRLKRIWTLYINDNQSITQISIELGIKKSELKNKYGLK